MAQSSGQDSEPMFDGAGDSGTLSPGHRLIPALSLVMAVFIVGMALANFVLQARSLPLSVLWAPMFAFSAWMSVRKREEWPDSTLPAFRTIGIVGLVLCALGAAYGVWEWRWRGGEPWFALYALLLLIIGPLGWRRRLRGQRSLNGRSSGRS